MPGITTGVAGYIVSRMGVDYGSRILFVFAFFSMASGVAVRWFLLKETSPDPKGREDLSTVSYREAFAALLHNARLRNVFLAQTALFLAGYLLFNFVPRFLVDGSGGLGLSEGASSIIPTARAVVFTLFPVLVTMNVREKNAASLVLVGIAVLAAGTVLHAVIPAGSLLLAAAASVVYGAGMGVSRPAMEALLGLAIPPRLRARLMSMVWTACMGGTGAASLAAGLVYDRLGPRMMMLAVAALTLAALAPAVSLWRSGPRKRRKSPR